MVLGRQAGWLATRQRDTGEEFEGVRERNGGALSTTGSAGAAIDGNKSENASQISRSVGGWSQTLLAQQGVTFRRRSRLTGGVWLLQVAAARGCFGRGAWGEGASPFWEQHQLRTVGPLCSGALSPTFYKVKNAWNKLVVSYRICFICS